MDRYLRPSIGFGRNLRISGWGSSLYNRQAWPELGSGTSLVSESFRIIHNFISVTSSSASSSVCTRSCLGVRVMRYGCGVREDWPLYPSRDMDSSGGDLISNAQSSREIASHSSRSATWMAGQIRRLRAHFG
jgi:hypothetical protein